MIVIIWNACFHFDFAADPTVDGGMFFKRLESMDTN